LILQNSTVCNRKTKDATTNIENFPLERKLYHNAKTFLLDINWCVWKM